jgi:sec-independent protein translocase protein TatB
MFGIGLGELALILVVAVVLVNPKDLPAFFRKAGKLWGELRSMGDKARDIAENAAKDAAKDIRIDEHKEGSE